ncbi:MAG: hypothetical protein WKF75_17560 [Singulisphaera sp.]
MFTYSRVNNAYLPSAAGMASAPGARGGTATTRWGGRRARRHHRRRSMSRPAMYGGPPAVGVDVGAAGRNEREEREERDVVVIGRRTGGGASKS